MLNVHNSEDIEASRGSHSTEADAYIQQRNTERTRTTQVNNPNIYKRQSTESFSDSLIFKLFKIFATPISVLI